MRRYLLPIVLMSATPAAADALPPEIQPTDFFPGPNTIVPPNAQFLVFNNLLSVQLQRTVDDEVLDVPVTWDSPMWMDPGYIDLGELTPGEVIQIHATCNGCTNSLDFTWTVSDEPDEVAPSFGDAAVDIHTSLQERDAEESVWRISVCFPLVDQDEPVFITMHRRDDYSILVHHDGFCRVGEDVRGAVGYYFEEIRAVSAGVNEYCVRATATDVAGNEGSLEEECRPFEDDGAFGPIDEAIGCSQASTTGIATIALLGIIIRATRRRGRVSASAR